MKEDMKDQWIIDAVLAKNERITVGLAYSAILPSDGIDKALCTVPCIEKVILCMN
jgi:hypothetical protein